MGKKSLLFADEVTVTSGTSADTFGSAGTITLGAQARKLLALYVSGCDTGTVNLTAEMGYTKLQLVAKSLSIADTRFGVGPYFSSQPATNDAGYSMDVDVIPIDIDAAGNEILSFATAPGATALNQAQQHMVSVVYSDGNHPPVDWLQRFPDIVPAKDGYVVDGTQSTTTRTALSNIAIPSWARALVGVKCKNFAGAFTAAKSVQTVFELTSTVAGMTPNKYPSNSISSPLGTPTMTAPFETYERGLPIYIPLTGRNETVTPYVNLVNAVTNACNELFGLFWR